MNKLNELKKLFSKYKIDGYFLPKNDEFFNEYIPENKDNLKFVSNFSGSYGFALILKSKNYLFVDGRYTLQAKIQSGKQFDIITIPKKLPTDILKNKKISIGFDPKLHTEMMLTRFFRKSSCKLMPINENLVNKIWKKRSIEDLNKFYKLKDKDSGETSKKKSKSLPPYFSGKDNPKKPISPIFFHIDFHSLFKCDFDCFRIDRVFRFSVKMQL